MRSPTPRRLAQAAGLVLVGAGLLAMAPAIAREGDAAQREKMSGLEGKAFPAEAMAGLTEWIGADAVSAESFTSGGVVAIAYIRAGNGASMTMLNTLTRLQRQQGAEGLTVFAVHPDEEWDLIAAKGEEGRLRVPIARDEGGKFAAALGIDDDPDLYLIDRAGLLRYADIETRSLPVAVSALLRETAAQAAANAGREGQARRIAMEEDGPAAQPTEGGAAPQADQRAYAKAAWPAANKSGISAKDVQGKQLPVPLGGETWITQQQDLSGKVVVLDFWATWCGPCIQVMPALDALQKQHGSRLAVVGVAGMNEDISKVRSFLGRKKHSYAQVFDASQRVANALEVRGIPHAVVMSTDGVVRWQGHPGSPEFRKAVEQVLRVDPGL